jgi:DNA topoisomerase I
MSTETIPKSVDKAMDKANPSNGHVRPGISIRNGPMQGEDIHMPDVNGVLTNGVSSKRKSRGSLAKPSYAELDTSDEDDQPLVRTTVSPALPDEARFGRSRQEALADSSPE